MAESKDRPGKVVHPRLPDELHTRLVTYANREHRSLQNAIVYLIDVGLRAEEQPPAEGGEKLHLR